jgi:hypothetical protein
MRSDRGYGDVCGYILNFDMHKGVIRGSRKLGVLALTNSPLHDTENCQDSALARIMDSGRGHIGGKVRARGGLQELVRVGDDYTFRHRVS